MEPNEKAPRESVEPTVDLSQIIEWMRAIIAPGQVVELRGLEHRKGNGDVVTMCGYYRGHETDGRGRDEIERLCEDAMILSGKSKGVYFTLNPINGKKFIEQEPRCAVAKRADSATDADVLSRHLILMDFDCKRPAGATNESATEAEKAKSLDRLELVRTQLAEYRWPVLTVCDSGNGYHLLCRCEADLTSDLLKRFLASLAQQFNTPDVEIDTKVFNLGRICKFPGTLAMKGSGQGERPHRRSSVLLLGDMETVVSNAKLEGYLVAHPAPVPQTNPKVGRISLLSDAESSTRMGFPPNDEELREWTPRINAYIDLRPNSVQGENGSGKLMEVAKVLKHGYLLTLDQAMPFLRRYSVEKSSPAWTDNELEKKFNDSNPGHHIPGRLADNCRREQEDSGSSRGKAMFRNFTRAPADPEEPEKKRRPTGRPVHKILDQLLDQTGGWPCRVGTKLFAPTADGHGVEWLTDVHELFAWIEKAFHRDDRSPIEWEEKLGCPTRQVFLKYCQKACREYESVEVLPHEPPQDNIYYAHPDIPEDCDGHRYFNEFVRFFSPSTPDDEDLIRAYFLSFVWGGSRSQRPLFIFQAEPGAKKGGRTSGKSTIVQVAGELLGGCINLTTKENDTTIQNRLLSGKSRTQRVVLIDNVKSSKFSNGYIEGLITQTDIDGKEMYEGQGSRPNFLTFGMTFNQPKLSKDFATRGFVVQLKSAIKNSKWRKAVSQHIKQYRWHIIGDMIITLKNPKQVPAKFEHTRFPEFDGDVFTCIRSVESLPAFIKLIESRSEAADADGRDAKHIREDIVAMLQKEWPNLDPDTDCVLIPTPRLQSIISDYRGSYEAKELSISATGQRLAELEIENLYQHDGANPYRGWVWRGKKCDPASKPRLWS